MTMTQLTARSGAPPRSASSRKQFGLAALLTISFILLFSGRAYAYGQVVAFGDSLSDNGNFFALTNQPGAPYYMGRVSNGPVWVETLAASLGDTLDDRAVAGATTGTVNTNGIGGGITNQINQYVSEGPSDPNALYTIWGGANDILALAGGGNPLTVISNAVTNLLTGIGALMANGAQNFLVVSLPDLGLTPRALASGGGAAGTAVSGIFNQALMDGLAATFPGANIDFLDTFSVLQDIVANPGSLGLTNVTEPCFDADALPAPTLCSNPDEYAFWDDIHPTRVLHAELAARAELALTPIPVPAAVWLFGSALGLIGWMRRRAA